MTIFILILLNIKMLKHDYFNNNCSGILKDIIKRSDVCTDSYAYLDLKVNDQKTYYTSSTEK